MKSRYHHGNLSQALVEAALAVVEAEGAAALSLRDVARQVGVSAAAVYRHFADKEALLAEVAAEGFAALNRAFAEALAAAPEQPELRLLALGEAYVRFGRGRPGLYRLMFGSPPGPITNPRLQQESQQAFFALLNGLAAVEPQAGPAQLTAAAVAAWSLVHGYVHLGLEGQLDHLPPDLLPDPASVLMHLRPPPQS